MAVKRRKLSDAISIGRRYVRSVDLGRDLADPNALAGYVVTPAVRDALERILSGLRKGSSQRAFRVTGPYGVGKSAFGLLLARLSLERKKGRDAASRKLLRGAKFEIPSLPDYVPLVLVGRRASFADCLLDAISQQAAASRSAKARAISKECAALSKRRAGGVRDDVAVLDLIEKLAEDINPDGGVLILVDEMGRFLEYAALHRRESDPSFFQHLAERAGGTGTNPIAVVAFLHHRFADYAAGLGEWVEAEWVRSAERYEDVVLHDSTEQTAFLLAEAIVHQPAETGAISAKAQKLYGEATTRGVFTTRKSEMSKIASRLYPLHPASVACIANVAGRFGQNERSVFSFLQSLEPHGFQRFIHGSNHDADTWYTLADLYDYLAAQGETRFRSSDRDRRWDLLRNAVAEARDLDDISLRTLKCVGVLAVLEPIPGLRADAASIAWCLGFGAKDCDRALAELVDRKLLYVRSHRDDYSLWASTSVDLDGWLDQARVKIPQMKRLDAILSALPPSRPLVAHKHYHRTGSLRTFSVAYQTEIGNPSVQGNSDTDGRIVVVPVYPDEDIDAAVAKTIATANDKSGLSIYCVRELGAVTLATAWDLALWRWIQEHCGDLRVDDLARREVRERVARASASLQSALHPLGRSASAVRQKWIHRGKTVDLATRLELNRMLSDVCDEVFADGPVLRNELINRSKLSSAAASARMRMLEAMIGNTDAPYLGFTGAPPERTIYLSLFLTSNVHREVDGRWAFAPPDTDPNNWLPVWKCIETFLRERGFISFSEIAAELERPPIGLRTGPALPMIVAFMLHHRREVAFFERNTFQPEITGAHFMRLAKNPANFALKMLVSASASNGVLERFSSGLEIWRDAQRPEPTLKPVVEAIYRWWQALPAYAKETGTVSKSAQAVRLALKKAAEPIEFIYEQLPQSCGLPSLVPEKFDARQVDILIEGLNTVFDELSDAGPRLRSEAEAALLEAFGALTLEKLRGQIGSDYGRHVLRLTDYRLRAFIDRASDSGMDDQSWLDGVTGLLTGKRIDAWKDDTIANFVFEVQTISARLARWLAHMKLQDADSAPMVSVHVVDTAGQEKTVVVRKGALTKDSAEKVARIKALLASAKDPSSVIAHVMAEELELRAAKEKTDG